MTESAELQRALVNVVSSYRERVPIYRIHPRDPEELEEEAVDLGRRFHSTYSKDEFRFDVASRRQGIVARLQAGGQVRAYAESEALEARRRLGPLADFGPVEVSRETLAESVARVASALNLQRLTRRQQAMKLERVVAIKSSGTTVRGERGPVTLSRAVGAYRRYIQDLPVWGRPSASISVGRENMVDRVSLDWRRIFEEPVDYTSVIDPEEGAKQVVEQMRAWVNGGEVGLKHYRPESFALGYLSLGKRRIQTVMQPVYFAVLKPSIAGIMGRVVVVAAGRILYEPLDLMPATPTRQRPRTLRPIETEVRG